MNYEDIIQHPHPVSANHPRMPLYDRAAQFSPFAALTGYETAIREAGRQTQSRPELGEEQKKRLDQQLRLLLHTLAANPLAEPEIKVAFFQCDHIKPGGSVISFSGKAKKIDGSSRQIFFTDGTALPVEEILSMEGELFHVLDDSGL